MQKNKINILCTRPLPQLLINEVACKSVFIEILPFIKTESILSTQVQQEIQLASVEKVTVVFTSMNAVDTITSFLNGHIPDWSIYCIGTTTGNLVKEYFGEASIAGMADDASLLATLIVEDRFVDEVIFFCGDHRRDELPALLSQQDVTVKEVIVYRTIALPHKINGAYDGILFFSPSAVQSFFQCNTVMVKTILFAIGNTTAKEIQKFSTNTIIISDAPGKENLIKKMIEFFT